MVLERFECEICNRRFMNIKEAKEHEENHKSYLSENMLVISHQPNKRQATLKFLVTDVFYRRMITHWEESNKEYDLQEYILLQFDNAFSLIK